MGPGLAAGKRVIPSLPLTGVHALRQTYDCITNLPAGIPVFPLSGALLLPQGELPLNVFEPRYLRMVDDALRGDRMIGVIQPEFGDDEVGLPALARVGCAGRITGFNETADGRYLIVLTGVCRFNVAAETTRGTPYRTVAPDWSPFADDLLDDAHDDLVDGDGLARALRGYLSRLGHAADWNSIEKSSAQTLINSISAQCPFTYAEKQALLEAQTLKDRCAALIALLDMGGRPGRDKESVQ